MEKNFSEEREPVKIGEWVLTIFISCIPIVGLIMLLVWAFGGGTHPSKANWAKANLIWAVVGIVFFFLFSSFIASVLTSLAY
jgi:Na+/phosphate symporter